MRRQSITLVTFVAILLIGMISIVATACGAGPQAARLSSADLSPEGILAKAMAASQEMTSARGSFDVQILLDADLSRLPSEAQTILGEPMSISGTMAYGVEPQMAEFSVVVSAAGETMDIGFKLTGDKAWIRFMEQWYEAPPEMEGMLGDAAAQGTDMPDVQRMLDDLDIDPTTWLEDLRLIGEETLDGVDTYHLAGTPDVGKMLADVIELLENGKLLDLADPSGTAGELMGSPLALPNADELQQMEEQLRAMLEDLAAELWVAKDGFAVVRLSAAARITPPPGEDTAGLNGIDISVTVSLKDIDQPLVVEPPASFKPWSAFEKALQDNPGLFMGPFSGAAFGGALPAAGTY